MVELSQISPGEVVVKAKFLSVKSRYLRKGLHITEAIIADGSARAHVFWFNQPYRSNSIKTEATYYLAGEYGMFHGRLSLSNPSCELESDFVTSSGRIVPVYKETKGLKSNSLRRLFKNNLDIFSSFKNLLPEDGAKSFDLMTRAAALRAMHFPSSLSELQHAQKTLAVEELFCISLASELNRLAIKAEKSIKIHVDLELVRSFVKSLKFNLTDAQRKAAWEAMKDMESGRPMNRLIEGDVGSGKTVVAALVALAVIKSDYQVAMMAPTEVLASQHYQTIKSILGDYIEPSEVVLLKGSLTSKQKRTTKGQISEGEAKFVIGTHALITKDYHAPKLGLVIIDEQHRFGVEQRKQLQKKGAAMPHVLSMTATPIPRTLALTLYGELEISLLDEMPPGRKLTITTVISPNSKGQMYRSLASLIDTGQQAFIVCPLIDESEALALKSVKQVMAELIEVGLAKYNPTILHGKMNAKEKEAVLEDFRSG